MTSLFFRLQKLNKEATPGPPWFQNGLLWTNEADRSLWIECRNSLPAVLNLIEAARLLAFGMTDAEAAEAGYLQTVRRLREAVAPFLSEPCEACRGTGEWADERGVRHAKGPARWLCLCPGKRNRSDPASAFCGVLHDRKGDADE